MNYYRAYTPGMSMEEQERVSAHNDLLSEIELEPRRSWRGNTWDDIEKWAALIGKDPSELIFKLDRDTPLGPHCLLIDRSVHGWGLEGNMPWNEDPEYIELSHDGVVAKTDKAVLLDFGGDEIWIPRSQIEDDDLEEAGTVSVAEWFAEQEGLEQYAA